MGTNYYVETTTCRCCGHKPERIHIGKNSVGWEFMFEAQELIRSFRDWRIYLTNKQIVDEYDRKVSYEDFLKLVYDSRDAGAKNHHDYCQNKGYSGTFKDDEGWAFIDGEFS